VYHGGRSIPPTLAEDSCSLFTLFRALIDKAIRVIERLLASYLEAAPAVFACGEIESIGDKKKAYREYKPW
jgi:hypothetical protein